MSPTNITFPKSFCSSHLFSFQTFSSRRWSVFTQSLSVNSALGTGQLPKIAIGNKKSAIFNFRLPKVNSQQFLLHQTPVEHCHCQARKKEFFFKSQILDLFSPPTTLIPQTAIVGDEKFRLKSK